MSGSDEPFTEKSPGLMKRSNDPEIPASIRGQSSARSFDARLMALVVVVCLLPSILRGQTAKPGEYGVKAVYLFNFGKFIEWPASAKKDDSFAICVLGADPFGSVLDATLAGETIENQKLVARRIASARDAADCRILFVSASEAPRLKDILASLNKSAILTVSDLPDFTVDGGMIQFVLQGDKVRFEVNLTAAEKANLTLSSQLLKVAQAVRRGPNVNGSDVKP